ncbi:MAG: MFS transporter [Candidatus Rokubacteria bacterium]|nr:MFS transporter [Candidatus Rokubacteria bacterium]
MPLITRRWGIVLALFTVTFGISMPLAAYGVFLPIIAETFGWSRGAIASALSLNLVFGGIAGFFVGRLADRHGPRVMLLVTVTIAGIGFSLVSGVTALWHLYALIGVMAGTGLSSFYLLSTSTVAHWFHDRRGIALAVVLAGFNLGYMAAGPIAAFLIAQLGWRPAYAVIGGGCAIVTALAATTVRLPRAAERVAAATAANVPAQAEAHGVTFRAALRDPRFWCLNVAWLLLGGTIFTFSVHAVPFARDQGVSLAVASLALTAYGFGSVAGRLVSGAISDRFGSRHTIRAAYVIELVALLILASAPGPGVLLPVMALFGVGAAGTDNTIVKVIPDLFGLRAIGSIMGLLTLGWRCGAALGPAAAGFLYDLTGSYAVPFGAAPVAVAVSWLLFWTATRRA